MLRRRSWLMVVPAISFVAMLSAQGCGSDSAPANLGDNGDSGGPHDAAADVQDPQFGPRQDAGNKPPSDASYDGPACATSNAQASRLPIYMQIVLDGSGSMDGIGDDGFIPGSREVDPLNSERYTGNETGALSSYNGLTGKKWLAARGALSTFWHELATQNSTTFGVGFYLFSSTDTRPSDQVDVALKAVNPAQENALTTRVLPQTNSSGNNAPPRAQRVYPLGGTPLRTSIRDQGDILFQFTPSGPLEVGGKKVLVVITDGVPTDSDGTREQCIAEATKLSQESITTFVIGVGNPTDPSSAYDEVFLGSLAVAGGADNTKCNPNWADDDPNSVPCHFQITPGSKSAADMAAEFTAAINKIRDIIIPCDFPLERPMDDAGQVDPDKVNVVFTPGGGGPEMQILKDSVDGWSYDAFDPDAGQMPTRVTLNGKACKSIKNDAGGRIRVVLGCKTGDPVIRIN